MTALTARDAERALRFRRLQGFRGVAGAQVRQLDLQLRGPPALRELHGDYSQYFARAVQDGRAVHCPESCLTGSLAVAFKSWIGFRIDER